VNIPIITVTVSKLHSFEKDIMFFVPRNIISLDSVLVLECGRGVGNLQMQF